MTLFSRTVHEVDEKSKLYYLINAFIGAYNRRTDVMERAVKLDERLRNATHKLDAAGEDLREAVNKNQP